MITGADGATIWPRDDPLLSDDEAPQLRWRQPGPDFQQRNAMTVLLH